MPQEDYEICALGQDGLPFHALIYVYRGRVIRIDGYDHSGPVWKPVTF